jgi:hypothetical protein
MSGDFAARAKAALGKLDVLMRAIPAKDRDNPHQLVGWLRAASQLDGLRPIEREALAAATVAVGEWREAVHQQNEFAALYHDPRIRKAAEATGKNIDWYWQRPAEAAKALINLKYTNPGLLDAKLLDRATDAAIAGRMYNTENNIKEPDPLDPMPNNEAQREAEIEALVQKSVRGGLSALEDARLDQLLGARLERDQAAEEKALVDYRAKPPAGGRHQSPDELRQLIARSLDGKLSTQEDARLNALLAAREIAAGRLEAPARGDDGQFDGADHEIDTALDAANSQET